MVRSTVVDNTYILTEWLPPVVKPQSVIQYEIYRSDDNITFNFISTVSANQTDFIDYDVDVQSKNYSYKIIVVNSCGIQEVLSNGTTTILLKGNKTEDRTTHLNWSPYDKWNEGVEYYDIESLDENGQWKFIKRVKGDTTSTDFRDE
jgi:predicted DNA binding protein